MTRDRIVGAEAMEGVVAMNKVKTIIGQTTSMEEAMAPFVDHGEPMEHIREVMDSPRQVLGIHSTKEYHNINIYVVSVIAEGIMTISVIPSSICFMQCNNKPANQWPNLLLNTTIQIRPINWLFKTGIPHTQLYIR